MTELVSAMVTSFPPAEANSPFVLKLIGNDSGDGRTNRGVAQLRINRGDPLLGLCCFCCREGPIVWIQGVCSQRDGLFFQTQFVFCGCQFQLRGFEIFLRDSTAFKERPAAVVCRARIVNFRARVEQAF
jgi:hypothetical protein